MKKILMVTEGLDGFGVSKVIKDLTLRLSEHYECHILHCASQLPSGWDHVTVYRIVGCNSPTWMFRWHPRLNSHVRRLVDEIKPDVIHIHGIWMAIHWYAVSAANKRGIPVLISPHGIIEPEAISSGNKIKVLMRKYLAIPMAKRNVRKADAVHVITALEKENIRTLVSESRFELISNAIEFPEIDSDFFPNWDESKEIVFLGRIAPKKGVDLLIRALAKIDQPNVLLRIIGNAHDVDYFQRLEADVKELGLSKRVIFEGPIYGNEKYTYLKKAWVVVVPSYSEVVALVNLESVVMKTPTITTFQTGLLAWAENGGLLIEPTVDDLTRALQESLSWSVTERERRAEQLYTYVKEHHSWERLTEQWIDLYDDLIAKRISNSES